MALRFPARAALVAATLLAPATLFAQAQDRSIDRMADRIADLAERIAASAQEGAARIADRVEKSLRDGERRRAERERLERDLESGAQERRVRIDTTLALAADATLDLSMVSGTIVVTAWGRPEARLVARAPHGHLDLSASAMRVRLEEIREKRWRRGGDDDGGRVEVSVPRGVRIVARTTSGDLVVRGTTGDVDGSTVSGDIRLEELRGRIDVSTVSGDVVARRVDGDVEVSAVSGDVTLTVLTGSLRASTTSGTLRLEGIEARHVDASTLSGDLDFTGPLDAAGRYEFKAHSGDVVLHLAGAANARFSLETFSGDLDFDFPVTLQPTDRGARRGRRLTFSIGEGGASVLASTFSGDLQIRKH